MNLASSVVTLGVALAATAMAMVVAMVRSAKAVLAGPEARRARNAWMFVYVVSWTAIVAILIRLISFGERRDLFHNLSVLAVVIAAWWAVHALLLWLMLALTRVGGSGQTLAVAGSVQQPAMSTALETEPERFPPARRECGWYQPAALVLSAVVVAQIPFLRHLDEALGRHSRLILTFSIAGLVIGFVVFMSGAIGLALAGGRPMTREEAEDLYRAAGNVEAAPNLVRLSAYRIFGAAVGAHAERELSLREIKADWRSGAWRRDPDCRRTFLMLGGGLLIIAAGFGFPIVLAPLSIKLISGAALVYAAVIVARAFEHA